MAAVTEFVIMSGPDVHDYLVTLRRELRAYLANSFPQFRFSLVSQDGEGMGFVVVPVVGNVSDWGSDAALEPDYAVIGDIRRALEAFRPVVATVH